MAINRRNFVKAGSTLAVSAAFSGIARAGLTHNTAEFRSAFTKTAELLRSSLTDRGFNEIQPLPIVTGRSDINGGLQFDADVSMLSPSTFVIQSAARVDDIAERGRTDLLPVFNVLACQAPSGQSNEEQAEFMLGLLTNDYGLDPDRIAFATIPSAETMRGTLEQSGFDFDAKVHVRDDAEALETRDTSGYFFPDPSNPDFFITSVGIYYRLTDEPDSGFAQYPPPAHWTEIGEFSLGGIDPPAFAIGVERLTLATSGFYPTWRDRLDVLFKIISSHAKSDKKPPALDFFRSSQ